MCGITGFVGFDGVRDDAVRAISAMTAALSHRGPDDSGIWVDERTGTALGHTRLSILDLSPLGRQPMKSICGRYVIVFNGEIYNHLDLRSDLKKRGAQFRGTSDTEVLAAAMSEWGPALTATRCNGMFAIAAWDRIDRELYLLRDRLGEKPLYYGIAQGALLFASELKAIQRYPSFDAGIDATAVCRYLGRGYIPAPLSIYRGISKLAPGCLVRFRAGRRIPDDPEPYWSLDEVIRNGRRNPFEGSPHDAADELEKLLTKTVRTRMQADVPLGAMLSGGVDSSAVAAIMQSQSTSPVKTFTIGFESKAFNEADHAAAVAKRLGTDHSELQIGSAELIGLIPRLSHVYDEPFADSSQIPTLAISEFARRHVTVALSGDGGDEVFGGYDRYRWMRSLWGLCGRMPGPVRLAGAAALRAASGSGVLSIDIESQIILPRKFRVRDLGDKAMRFAAILAAPDIKTGYEVMTSVWLNPSGLISADVEAAATGPAAATEGLSFIGQMMRTDTLTYLPDDILVKVDRASMSVALEIRVPMLDHRIVEFGWRLPSGLREDTSPAKAVLRSVVHRYLPKELMSRPKMGFAAPVGHWLKTDLHQWAESLLSESRLGVHGLLNAARVRQRWREHLSGRRDCSHEIWSVLMLQTWLDTVKSERSNAGDPLARVCVPTDGRP